MLDSVSTLLITVGLPQRPLCDGKGGLGEGMPRLPSMDAIIAVSSPHTNAPAPSITCKSKLYEEPNICLPNIPALYASWMAFRILFTASGYSART